jgi:hypothetical protein
MPLCYYPRFGSLGEAASCLSAGVWPSTPIPTTSSSDTFGCFSRVFRSTSGIAKLSKLLVTRWESSLHFDPVSLTGSSRKMGKVLVEMDLSAGLPEKLEIDWRGRKTLQTLDYLGLPFRCNLCRETGHLRRNCPGKSLNILSEEDDLSLNPPEYMDVDPSLESWHSLPDPPPPLLPGQPEPLSTKIFHLCPSLYFSLTDAEKDFINSSSSLFLHYLPTSRPLRL